MAKQKSASISPEVLAMYDSLIGTVPGVERKGATVPYTSLNGHMFSYLGPDGQLALRLPKEMLEGFLAKYKTKHAESHGIVQKEYAAVPALLFKTTAELEPYFRGSYDYVRSQKPKPTTKGKKK